MSVRSALILTACQPSSKDYSPKMREMFSRRASSGCRLLGSCSRCRWNRPKATPTEVSPHPPGRCCLTAGWAAERSARCCLEPMSQVSGNWGPHSNPGGPPGFGYGSTVLSSSVRTHRNVDGAIRNKETVSMDAPTPESGPVAMGGDSERRRSVVFRLGTSTWAVLFIIAVALIMANCFFTAL